MLSFNFDGTAVDKAQQRIYNIFYDLSLAWVKLND